MILQLYKVWRDGQPLEHSYLSKLAGLAWTDTRGLLYQRLLAAQVILSFLWVRLNVVQTRPEGELKQHCVLPGAALHAALVHLSQC